MSIEDNVHRDFKKFSDPIWGFRVPTRGATGAARGPKPGKTPIMAAPQHSNFQTRGKTYVLPVLPHMAPLPLAPISLNRGSREFKGLSYPPNPFPFRPQMLRNTVKNIKIINIMI